VDGKRFWDLVDHKKIALGIKGDKEIGAAIGVTRGRICQYRRSASTMPLIRFAALCKYLGIPPEECGEVLLGDENPRKGRR